MGVTRRKDEDEWENDVKTQSTNKMETFLFSRMIQPAWKSTLVAEKKFLLPVWWLVDTTIIESHEWAAYNYDIFRAMMIFASFKISYNDEMENNFLSDNVSNARLSLARVDF